MNVSGRSHDRGIVGRLDETDVGGVYRRSSSKAAKPRAVTPRLVADWRTKPKVDNAERRQELFNKQLFERQVGHTLEGGANDDVAKVGVEESSDPAWRFGSVRATVSVRCSFKGRWSSRAAFISAGDKLAETPAR